jgi:hypothetical protein
MQIANKKPA